MIKVVICNGKPGVGKSEFQRLCAQQCGLFGKEIGFTPDKNLYVDIIIIFIQYSYIVVY